MEIIDGADDPNADLVQIAFADTREEAELVEGLLREAGIRSLARLASPSTRGMDLGLLSLGPRSVYVRPDDAAAARELLGETMVEDPQEEIPESANARYLADAGLAGDEGEQGGRARDYSVLGAFARGYLVAIVVAGLALAVFLVLR